MNCYWRNECDIIFTVNSSVNSMTSNTELNPLRLYREYWIFFIVLSSSVISLIFRKKTTLRIRFFLSYNHRTFTSFCFSQSLLNSRNLLWPERTNNRNISLWNSRERRAQPRWCRLMRKSSLSFRGSHVENRGTGQASNFSVLRTTSVNEQAYKMIHAYAYPRGKQKGIEKRKRERTRVIAPRVYICARK